MPQSRGGNWRAVGASVQGLSHVKAGVPCQDSCHALELPGGILVAAVADGAGSAAVSELGSALAARAAVDRAASQLYCDIPQSDEEWETLLRDVLLNARQTVADQAELLELQAVDLATTLILAVAMPDRICAVQVGDGAAVVRLADETLLAVTRPPQGEFINETTFLTSDGLLHKAQFTVQHFPVTGVALLTDGLQMLALKMPQGEPHTPFFLPLLRGVAASPDTDHALEQLRNFLQSSRIRQRADDDLTLMLAVRVRSSG